MRFIDSLESRLLLSINALAVVTGPNGANPNGGLIADSAGNLYGTTAGGGANGDGAVFELVKGSPTVTVLVSFNDTDGATPDGDLLIDSSGDLYGAASAGGANSEGVVFEIVHGSASITDLVSFNGTDGASPQAGLLMDSAGNLYGTTSLGGGHGGGSVFELVHGATSTTVLAAFHGSNGDGPVCDLVMDSAGNLYGTTEFGGAFSQGTLFEVVHGSGTVTDLASFDGADGSYPQAGLLADSAGNLYGAAFEGGPQGFGAIFELAAGSHSITDLAFFNGYNGRYPRANLLFDAAGNIFGTAWQGGGASHAGTVFELPRGSSSIIALGSFTGPNGARPYAGLTLDSAGDLFGDTDSGGPDGYGVIFELPAAATPSLTLTTPAQAASVNQGDSFSIAWTGGDPADTVQLWAEGGPNNAWSELTPGVPDSQGSFSWNTTAVLHGYYYFQAWDIPATGMPPYSVVSPNYLHVISPAAQPPNIALNNPPFSTDTVAQGDPYTLTWTASDGAGDTNPLYVQLWVYSGDTGQWSQLPNAAYLPASPSAYVWDTTGMPPGYYSFAIHATNGDQWSYAASPGFLDITVPTPTITFLTPTSGQTASAGGAFALNWSITGLPSIDASDSTVQIWTQYLDNGSPVWTQIAAGLDASTGTYTWSVPSSPGPGTYYAFVIWLNYGNQSWSQPSPNWLQTT